MEKRQSWQAILCLLLCALLALSVAPAAAFAADAGTGYAAGYSGSPIVGAATGPLRVSATEEFDGDFMLRQNFYRQEQLYVEIDSDNFVWSGSPQEVDFHFWYNSGLNLSLGYDSHSGGLSVRYVNFQNGRATVEMQWPYDPDGYGDFSGELYLTIDGVACDNTRTPVQGKYAGRRIDFVFWDFLGGSTLTGGYCVVALRDYEQYHFDLGEGVYLYSPLTTGQEYYGTADAAPTAQDLQVMQQHPQIVEVRNLSVSGSLRQSEMQMYWGDYHVYDGNLQYLGKNDDALPYRDTYYFAVSKLGEALPQPYAVTYHPNGADGGEVPVDSKLYYPGQSVPVRFDHTLYKADYYFEGWRIDREDGFTETHRPPYYNDTSSATMPAGPLHLYAVWHPEISVTRVQGGELTAPGYPSLRDISVLPKTEVRIPLPPEYFEWRDESRRPDKVTLEHLWNTGVRSWIGGGSMTIKSLSLKEDADGAYISLVFVDYYLDTPFDILVYLTVDGRRYDDFGVRISGTLIDDGSRPPSDGGFRPSSRGSGSGSTGSSGSVGGGNRNAKTTLSKESAAALVKTALQADSGKGAATVRVKNPGVFSLDVLQAMTKAAGGRELLLRADSMADDGRSVDVRISIDPAMARTDLNLAGSTGSHNADTALRRFGKWYSNAIAVVSLEQTGTFGTPVRIAAKVDLSDMDVDNLVFYSYDRDTNTYKRFDCAYWVDAQGYLHFTTELAGDIVISDGVLSRK